MLLGTRAPFTVTAIGTRSHGAVVAPGGIDVATILAGTDLPRRSLPAMRDLPAEDRKSTRLNSSHEWISYAVFCLKKKTNSTKATAPTCAARPSSNMSIASHVCILE